MKDPIYYRRFDYDKALIPNKYLASLEDGVSTIEQATEKTGFTIGYPGWNLVYGMVISHLHPEKDNIIIETGTNEGCTTIILAQALKDSGCNGKVYTVELDKKNYETALTNLEKAGVSDFVEAVNASSHDFLKDLVKINSSIRIAFLDASHLFDDVLAEFDAILPSLSPESLVIFDNTYQIADENEDQRVNGALRDIIKRHGGNLVNFETVSWYTPGLAVWQKSPLDCMGHQYDKGKIASGTQTQYKDQIVGLFSQAHNLAISGDYKAALELYDRIIADVPDLAAKTPQINYERALCLKALGKIHDAEQAIRSSLSVKPDDPEYLQLLSKIQFAIGSDIITGRESKVKTDPANIKQAEEVDQLYAEVKTFLPLVEEADVRQALKAISLIDKRMIGRACGKVRNKLLNYLSIVQFARATDNRTVDSIEIGTLFGGSCLMKLFAMRDLGIEGKVVCIDPMTGYYDQQLDPTAGIPVTAEVFLENIERFGFTKEMVDLREAKSTNPRATESLREGAFATLLIDGDHSYRGARYDWENYNRFIADNGIVLLDDYLEPKWPEITVFANELIDSLPDGWRKLGHFGTVLLLSRLPRRSKQVSQEPIAVKRVEAKLLEPLVDLNKGENVVTLIDPETISKRA
ncbi:MAG: class I SAM-dependent methyltransferase, partial [Planctomycetota bacterium]